MENGTEDDLFRWPPPANISAPLGELNTTKEEELSSSNHNQMIEAGVVGGEKKKRAPKNELLDQEYLEAIAGEKMFHSTGSLKTENKGGTEDLGNLAPYHVDDLSYIRATSVYVPPEVVTFKFDFDSVDYSVKRHGGLMISKQRWYGFIQREFQSPFINYFPRGTKPASNKGVFDAFCNYILHLVRVSCTIAQIKEALEMDGFGWEEIARQIFADQWSLYSSSIADANNDRRKTRTCVQKIAEER